MEPVKPKIPPPNSAHTEEKGEESGGRPGSTETVHGVDSFNGGMYRRKSFPPYGENEWFTRSRMPRTPAWSIVWSDLMMTMFIFFVVLYAYSVAQKQFLGPKGLGDAADPAPPVSRVMQTAADRNGGKTSWPTKGFIEKMFNLSKQTLSDEVMQEFASIELVPEKTVRIILTSDLLFDSGQAKIKEHAKRSLAKIARLLRQTPYAINVIGHTDNRPIATHQFPSNWELSTARASAVARYLVDEMGIPGNQFYITGHGSYQPVRPNNSPENRAANRRVEIVITREKPGASLAAGEKRNQTGGQNSP